MHHFDVGVKRGAHRVQVHSNKLSFPPVTPLPAIFLTLDASDAFIID